MNRAIQVTGALVRPPAMGPSPLGLPVQLEYSFQPLVSEGLWEAVSSQQFDLPMTPVHLLCEGGRHVKALCVQLWELGPRLLSHSGSSGRRGWRLSTLFALQVLTADWKGCTGSISSAREVSKNRFGKTEVINVLALCRCFSPAALFYASFIVGKSSRLILTSMFDISFIIS